MSTEQNVSSIPHESGTGVTASGESSAKEGPGATRPASKPQNVRDDERMAELGYTQWRYRVTLKGTVWARGAEEAEERAMDDASEGLAEDDEVEVERA